MGRQLRFLHTAYDIPPLLKHLEKLYGRFPSGGTLYEPSQMLHRIISEMNTWHCCQYSIVFAPDASFKRYGINASISEGSALEFSNCGKWTDATVVYYEVGRIYLMPTRTGTFDHDVLNLFNKLCRYFKKNYEYHKGNRLYISHTFMKLYEDGAILASQCGNPMKLVD